MKDMLFAVVALVSAVAAVFSFIKYINSADDKLYLGVAIVCAVITIALGAIFLSGRVNKNEDIHITE